MRLFEKTFGRFGDVSMAEFGGESDRESVSVGYLVRFVVCC